LLEVACAGSWSGVTTIAEEVDEGVWNALLFCCFEQGVQVRDV
jgi:hypothetical protein